MSILETVPWIKEHIDLYKKDPVAAHDWVAPGDTVARATLLLTTKGRKSGEPRDAALLYGKAGNRYVIVASLGGAPDHPAWYKNLQADPEAEIQVGADHHHVTARDAEGAERAELWALMVGLFPTYEEYAKRTEGVRQIPVVVLDPK